MRQPEMALPTLAGPCSPGRASSQGPGQMLTLRTGFVSSRICTARSSGRSSPCNASSSASTTVNTASSSESQPQVHRAAWSTTSVGECTASGLARFAAAALTFLQAATPKEFQRQTTPFKGATRTFHMAAAVLPFASLEMGYTTFLMTKAVGKFMKTYLLLLFLRVLLSWFPAFNWERQPWLALRQITDPYLQLFRGIIPPLLGMVDFTPLLGFFILQWLSGMLQGLTVEDPVEKLW